MAIHKLISSFNSGEMSPLMGSRVAVEKYESGCRSLRNMIIHTHGPAFRRPGLEYLGTAHAHGTKSRLFGFNFSVTTNFVIEIAVGAFRFWSNSLLVESPPGTPYTVAHSYTEDEIFELQITQVNDVCYITHYNHPPSKLSRQEDTNWTFAAVAWDWPAMLDENIENKTITVHHTSGADRAMEASYSIFQAGHVGSYWQIAHRRSQSFVECTLAPPGPTFADTISASLRVLGKWDVFTYGIWAATFHLERQTPSGSGWEIIRSWSSQRDRNVIASGEEEDEAVLRLRVETGATSIASGLVNPRFLLEPADAKIYGIVKVKSVVTNAPVAVNISSIVNSNAPNFRCRITTASNHGLIEGQTVTFASVSASGGLATAVNGVSFIVALVDGATVFEINLLFQGFWTYTSGGTITPLGDGKLAIVDVVKDLHAATATELWTEGAWSELRGYPRASAIHEQRLLFGGTRYRPQTVWGSVSSDYENFRRTSVDDGSFSYQIAAQQSNPIQWMTSQGGLIIGTEGEEWLVGSGIEGKPITPTSIKIERQSGFGSAYAATVLANEAVIFLQRNVRQLRHFTRNDLGDLTGASNLTTLAEHITAGGIIQMAFQSQPTPILWCVTGDGRLIGMTFEKEQNVFGWHEHVTDGLIESVAIIYGDPADEVWVTVRREITISGSPTVKRYMERLNGAGLSRDFSGRTSLVYVDCASVITSVNDATTLGGLNHLKGKEVVVLVNGTQLTPNPTVDTAAGTILIAAGPPKLYVVGLPYESRLQPMKQEVPLQDGTAQGRRHKLSGCTIRLHESLGGEVTANPGDASVPAEPIPDPTGSLPLPLFSGERDLIVTSRHEDAVNVTVRSSAPFPFNVTGLILNFDVFGK